MDSLQWVSVASCTLLFSSHLSLGVAHRQCYNPDGSPSLATLEYSPCLPALAETHCCHQNETCVTGGLCWASYDGSTNTGGPAQTRRGRVKTVFKGVLEALPANLS